MIATDCDTCQHPLAEHDPAPVLGVALACSYVIERHQLAVDDFSDRLCDCIVPYWPYDGKDAWKNDEGLAARWHLAKAASLLPEGEADRAATLAEAVKVACEGVMVL